MAVNMTIRNVPQDVRDELADRAARAGQSLQEYVRAALIDLAAKPEIADVLERAAARRRDLGGQADVGAERIVEIIREMRGPLP